MEHEKMEMSEKITLQRRKLSLSQEQLAEHLGVTRQSVSKWELGVSVPELSKLIAMSELFQVSVDYLVKDSISNSISIEEKRNDENVKQQDVNIRLEEKVDKLTSYIRGYQYTSKTKIKGIPLVSIRLTRRMGKDGVAKGIIAIGNAAIGIISFGAASVGVISLGAVSVGILSVGAVAAGIMACGPFAAGVIAMGNFAVGIYSMGVVANGSEIAVGVVANADTAIGEKVNGSHCLSWHPGITRGEIGRFIEQYHPKLWSPLKDILSVLGAHMK